MILCKNGYFFYLSVNKNKLNYGTVYEIKPMILLRNYTIPKVYKLMGGRIRFQTLKKWKKEVIEHRKYELVEEKVRGYK